MENNTKLDNLTCQEIKEMIYDNRIQLVSLETSILQRLMDHEINLLCEGHGDEELIEKCAGIICERNIPMMSHDKFISIIDTLQKENTEQPTRVVSVKRFSLRRALLIAAMISTIVVCGTMVASAFGFNLLEYIVEIAGQPDGTEIEADGLTFYKGGQTKKYTTLKEAVEKENLNIMYPEAFPNGIGVETIMVADSDIGDKNIQILTKDKEIIIVVDTKVAPKDNAYDDGEIYKIGNIVYKLFENGTENKYNAYCNFNNCDYIIATKNYEDLIFMIDNMKER